ncbi:hypothetical protein FXV77_20285 [Sphingobacterium phlebotomi]|uniref:Transposase/invertase (TIGR01784 family) n=1 Tax=Sphingobacterium phlebotomi TaxID=2605433 RepID=A0A5D4GUH1_9SPHI|nr:PD-(D/E)XK nuclease family transposase [Sphingobacterium phlebotomi]TYR31774.1 hypothetical protein FXV77_20285 [Sphingobacterium phlebotomi]
MIGERIIEGKASFGFKRIFGTEANKDLLISLLNELFQGRKLIEDLYYNKNEHVGDTEEFAIAAYIKLNKEERDMYNASLKNKWDAESIRQTAILEKEQARTRGLEEGREEGRQEGLKEGEHQKAVAIARDMKKEGIAVEQIAKFTKLTVKEIDELR